MSAENPQVQLPPETPNPFHPDKLALHAKKLSALAAGRMIAPQTVEVDFTDGFCNQGCTHCCFGSNQLLPIQNMEAWQRFKIDGCPNPCKFYRYNEVVEAAAAANNVPPPPQADVAHNNFV
jgi:hypothetical protein